MFDTVLDDLEALDERVRLPHDLEPVVPLSEFPTSGWLGVELDRATADPGLLSDAQVVEAIVGFERMAGWVMARQASLLASFARRRPTDDWESAQSDVACPVSRYAADEIGLALRLARGAAAARLAQAQRLDGELAGTRQAWEDGRIDAAKVRAVCDGTVNLDPSQARAVQDRVLGRASEQTAGRLKAAVKRAVISTDPAGAARRFEKARSGRRVGVCPEQDGMASLWAVLPAPDAISAYEWLTRLARGMGADDPRCMDARRADLMTALLTGRLTVAAPENGHGGTGRGTVVTGSETGSETGDGASSRMPMPAPVNPGKPLVQVVIPHSTLTGAAEHPGELVGYGPIPAPLAREIAADGVWRRLVTDPLSGALLDYGRDTYRPPAALADFVRARDVHCRHPICRRRAIDSELDHTIAFAGEGGETSQFNLYGACPHHHHLKHDEPGWSVVQHRDGRVTWTTPTGHSYTSDPYDYRVEDDSDPVFDYVKRLALSQARSQVPAPLAADTEADDEPPF